MKKILIITLALFMTKVGFTQEDSDKSFRFGLKILPSFNWYAPDDQNNFSSDGVKMKFGWGLQTDFKLSDNIWISTGLELNYDGGVINYLENPDDSIGYFFHDDQIVEYKENNGEFTPDTTGISNQMDFIRLDQREYKVNYVTLPFYLKMRTNEIGYMTYFGQFGLNTSVKTRGRANDVGTNLSSANTPALNDLNIDSEMQLLKFAITIGGGAEYNFSGSTSVFFAANFNYGLTNAVRRDSKHLIDLSKTADGEAYKSYTPQKAIPYSLNITIGIMF